MNAFTLAYFLDHSVLLCLFVKHSATMSL